MFLQHESSNGTLVYPYIRTPERFDLICRSEFIIPGSKQYIPILYLYSPSALKIRLQINETHSLSLISSVSSTVEVGLGCLPQPTLAGGSHPKPVGGIHERARY